MLKKKIYVTLLFIIGCQNDPASVNSDNENLDRVHGTLHGIITDKNTNSRLENITVKCLVGNSILSTVSDVDG